MFQPSSAFTFLVQPIDRQYLLFFSRNRGAIFCCCCCWFNFRFSLAAIPYLLHKDVEQPKYTQEGGFCVAHPLLIVLFIMKMSEWPGTVRFKKGWREKRYFTETWNCVANPTELQPNTTKCFLEISHRFTYACLYEPHLYLVPCGIDCQTCSP